MLTQFKHSGEGNFLRLVCGIFGAFVHKNLNMSLPTYMQFFYITN